MARVIDRGTYVGAVWVSGEQMSTAICRIQTREGFAIAADGRRVNAGRLPHIENNVQKIFEAPHGQLAYSIAGNTGLGPPDSEEIVFAFAPEVRQAMILLRDAEPEIFSDYLTLLRKTLEGSLHDCMNAGRIAPFDDVPDPDYPGSTIAWVFVDGYYNGERTATRLRFFHKNQSLKTAVHGDGTALGVPIPYGSQKIISELFYGSAPSLAPYRRSVESPFEITLPQAIDVAEAYIRAYSDPEVLRLDPTIEPFVGGRTHIATITPSSGFQWVPGFEPIGH